MAADKKQQVRLIFKLGAFGAFIMLGYLGLRSYRASIEKLRINECTDEIIELVMNIQDRLGRTGNYAGLDYNAVSQMNLFPKRMKKEGYREYVNAYFGGVDIFYSPREKGTTNDAFEISFQGVSSTGCKGLLRLNWEGDSLIATAGYSVATPSGVLDEVYLSTKPEEIKKRNVFKGTAAMYASDDTLDAACACKENTCSVVWKFK